MAKIERTKNTVRGSIWGTIDKISSMILPFLVRTILIYKFGIEYLGLNSLFASVLQVLSITELGFASATVYAMYKPIAQDDYETVGAILYYLKKVYTVVGTIMLVVGLVFMLFLPQMVNGDVPDSVNLYILYIIYLLDAVFSYFFMGYKSALLNALQCNYVISKINFVSNLGLKVLQCILLLLIPNYYLFVLLIPVFTIFSNFMKARVVDKEYSYYLKKVELNRNLRDDIKSKIFPLMSTKLAVVLLNSADTLVISAFLGLAETAMYNNYYFIMISVESLIFVIHGAMLGGVGNSLVVDDKDKILENFNKLNFINSWLISVCCTCFLCMYQPFMEIWVGKEYALPYLMVIMFTAFFYSGTILRVVVIYKDAAGIWKQDMFRTYLSCSLNILINIVSVKFIGLYGVIGSSVFVSVFIDPWIARTLYKHVLNVSSLKFYISLIKNIFITVLISSICVIVTAKIPYGIMGLLIRMLVCVFIANAGLYVFYNKDPEFNRAKEWILLKINKVM